MIRSLKIIETEINPLILDSVDRAIPEIGKELGIEVERAGLKVRKKEGSVVMELGLLGRYEDSRERKVVTFYQKD